MKKLVLLSCFICLGPLFVKAECTSYLSRSVETDLSLYKKDIQKYFQNRIIKMKSLDFLKDHISLYSYSDIEVAERKFYAQNAKDLGVKIKEATKNELPDLKTVLYPASGYDAGTVFHVFPDVNRVIGLDSHPFWLDQEHYSFESSVLMELLQKNQGMINLNNAQKSWAQAIDVNRMSFLSEVILSRLVHGFQNFRLRAIYEIRDFTQDKESNFEILSHGVVVFDTGDGTPLRSYLHLHTPIFDEGNVKMFEWWKRDIFKVGFEGVFYKAAMNAQTSTTGYEIAEYLRYKKGLILDSDSILIAESSDQFGSFYKKSKTYEIDHQRFGYSPFVTLTLYK